MLQQSEDKNIISQETEQESGDGYVVGVDIGGTNLRLALADSVGKVLAKWNTSTAGIQDANVVVEMVREGVEHLLQQTGVPRSQLRAIAAGAPGVTDVDNGIVIVTSYLMGWRNVPLREMLEAAIGVPAAIDNDVNLAALGEGRSGSAKGTGDFVFLAIGTGVGAGIVLHGRLFHGGRWTAGEIGYMLVPGVAEAPVERGKPGVLEGLVGGEGIKAQWQAEWTDGSPAPKDLSATEIFDLATRGNKSATVILEKAARTLAYAIYNIYLVLNCPLAVLGGSVGMHPALRAATERVLAERGSRVRVDLTSSILGTEAQLLGAVALAIDTANDRRQLTR